MWRRSPIALFLCRFVAFYLLLASPWPGLNRAYGVCLRALARVVFAGETDSRLLSFETAGAGSAHPLDTRIVIANRAQLHADGSGPVRNLDIGLSFQPVALLLALILATPLPWRRRGWAILWGLLGLHAALLLCLGFFIWAESADISLVTLSPFWMRIAALSELALIAQFSPAMPVLIWILATFRREDRAGHLGLFAFGPAGGGSGLARYPVGKRRAAGY